MALLAALNPDNTVDQVIVVDDSILVDPDGSLTDASANNSCQELYETDLTFLLASEDGSVRGNCPSPGYIYDDEHDIFIPQQPFQSWVLDPALARWVAPVPVPEPMPGEGPLFIWDEEARNWKQPPS